MTELSSAARISGGFVPLVGDGFPDRVHAVFFHRVWNQVGKWWLEALPIGRSCERRGLIFLPQPLLEKIDGHLTHGAPLSRGLGFHLAVEFVRNLKGCLHEASLLYCWVMAKKAAEIFSEGAQGLDGGGAASRVQVGEGVVEQDETVHAFEVEFGEGEAGGEGE